MKCKCLLKEDQDRIGTWDLGWAEVKAGSVPRGVKFKGCENERPLTFCTPGNSCLPFILALHKIWLLRDGEVRWND